MFNYDIIVLESLANFGVFHAVSRYNQQFYNIFEEERCKLVADSLVDHIYTDCYAMFELQP